jgi:hypothetical protein
LKFVLVAVAITNYLKLVLYTIKRSIKLLILLLKVFKQHDIDIPVTVP